MIKLLPMSPNICYLCFKSIHPRGWRGDKRLELLAIAITATPQDLFKPTGETDLDEFSKMTAALLDFIEL
jgi:hypothetical protein